MADPGAAKLCTQIVRSHFGSLTATVASALLTRGRLNLIQIVQFTSLKYRTVRAAVLVLFQQNLLWRSSAGEEKEVLEFNVDECLTRLRFGRYVWWAEKKCGALGGAVVQLVLDHGKLKPPDIYRLLQESTPDLLLSECRETMYKLVSERYLRPTTALSHISPREKLIQYEVEEVGKMTGFLTAKEQRQAKEIALARVKREELEEVTEKKATRCCSNVDHDEIKKKPMEEEADDEVHFRVNFNRFDVFIRNRLVEAAAFQRFNEGAVAVIRATLSVSENKQQGPNETKSDPVSVNNISARIPEDEDLSRGLHYPPKHKPSHMDLLKEYLGMLASADNPSPSGKAASFVSLSGSKVQVEFDIIHRRMQLQALEAACRDRHGNEGVRVMRLLLETGKMDEKQISKIAMMAPKDCRPLLFALSADNFISLQEVPRGADRNPTRTFFLWYVDLRKAYATLLRSAYKTLYNIGVRRQSEAEEPLVKAIVEKSQRSDVSQDVERLLTRNEREELVAWEKRRDELTLVETRVEEVVFILRTLGNIVVDDQPG
ncbi:hypothetical protein BJ322DRAFT_998384 [Thelephora terrestris]|uniref:DNA-directed RNA polymerase III subunit RPC3 n=1 Tax=Thelephora terrestris TaxID=56493 RepID=A0A9P6HQH7_9AGAM|nr:hypothetical protein BJ322DRAFT_998384 [Thelephora terrestris]